MLGFHSFFFITHINGKESFNFGFCFVFPKKKKNSRNVLLASEQYSCIYFIINWPRGLYVWTSCTSTYIHLSSIYHPTSLASCPPFKLKGRLQITKHREPMWAALMSLLVVPVVGRVSKKKKKSFHNAIRKTFRAIPTTGQCEIVVANDRCCSSVMKAFLCGRHNWVSLTACPKWTSDVVEDLLVSSIFLNVLLVCLVIWT